MAWPCLATYLVTVLKVCLEQTNGQPNMKIEKGIAIILHFQICASLILFVDTLDFELELDTVAKVASLFTPFLLISIMVLMLDLKK